MSSLDAGDIVCGELPPRRRLDVRSRRAPAAAAARWVEHRHRGRVGRQDRLHVRAGGWPARVLDRDPFTARACHDELAIDEPRARRFGPLETPVELQMAIPMVKKTCVCITNEARPGEISLRMAR